MQAKSPFSSPRAARKPKPGRPVGRFTQHRRIDRLREVLEDAPRGLTLEEIAHLLRITQRSVRRYLNELDAATELESIETAPGGAHVWRIKPSERGRAVPLRRAQAYALLATRRELEVLRGSALFDELELAFSSMERVAKTPFRASEKTEISGESELGARFFVLPPAARSYQARGEDMDELFRAVADLRVVRYRPRTRAGEPRGERVELCPYAMVLHKGAIVVLGARKGTSEVETLPFEAMTEVRASESERFELPPTFDASHYVHGELGVGPPQPRVRAVVEFDARVGDDIRSRKWHPAQKVATAPDGRVRLSVPLVSTQAIASWVLSFGDSARVVDPPELAREVGAMLTRAAARYR